jgi:hypothetical protein
MENTDIISFEKLYYDEYECYNGDGFYPSVKKDETCCKEIIISFIYNSKLNCWIQKSGMCISGLDGNNAFDLLNILNKKNNLNCHYLCNIFGSKIVDKSSLTVSKTL